MQQRTRERGKILHFLAFAQLLDLHCAEGNILLAQFPCDQRQVRSGANQHSDAELLILFLLLFHPGPVFLDDGDNSPGFRIRYCLLFLRAGFGTSEQRPDMHARPTTF